MLKLIRVLYTKPLINLFNQVTDLLQRDGMTKGIICTSCGLQSRQLERFMRTGGQYGCTTAAYTALWSFFEKLRILEGTCKSEKRLYNEKHYPNGFGLTTTDAVRLESTYRLDDDDDDDDNDNDESNHHHPPAIKNSKLGAKGDGLRLMKQISQLQYEPESDYIFDSYSELIEKVRRGGKEKGEKKGFFFINILYLYLYFCSCFFFAYCIFCMLSHFFLFLIFSLFFYSFLFRLF